MTIQTKLPSSIRTPGAYSDFDWSSAKLSLLDLGIKVVVIGEMLAGGTATVETPIQVFSEPDADLKAGQGSLGAIMCRGVLAQQALSGPGAQLWYCGIAEPAGGTKAQETVTFTGPATESGNAEFEIAGVPVIVGINNGDAAATMAAAFKAACDAIKSLIPWTFTVAAGVATGTHTTKGVNGNDSGWRCTKKPAGVGVALAQSVAGAGAATIANALAALYNQPYDAISISNHTSIDVAAILVDAALAWGYQNKNYRDYFMGENGSLSTAETLQAAANDFRLHIGSCEQTGSPPGIIAVACAAAEYSRQAPNANLDGEPCIVAPPPPAYAYTGPEIESALAGGVIPIVPSGQRTIIIMMITSQISYNGVSFEPLRDTANHRTLAYVAKQVELNYTLKFRQATGTAFFLANVRDMIVDVQRLAENDGYIRNVDDHLDGTQTAWAFVNSSRRVNAANPIEVSSPVHQASILNQLYSA